MSDIDTALSVIENLKTQLEAKDKELEELTFKLIEATTGKYGRDYYSNEVMKITLENNENKKDNALLREVARKAELLMKDLQIDKSQPAAMAIGSLKGLIEALAKLEVKGGI